MAETEKLTSSWQSLCVCVCESHCISFQQQPITTDGIFAGSVTLKRPVKLIVHGEMR